MIAPHAPGKFHKPADTTAVVTPMVSLIQKIARLPAGPREEAMRLIQKIRMGQGSSPILQRDPEKRAKLAGDPWKYIRDILGYMLTSQQEKMIYCMEEYDRLLMPAAHNIGKTWGLAAYGLYRFDAVAAVPDRTGREQGCRILLPGPGHDTVFATVYAEILSHADRAESLGNPMPPNRSSRSVNWLVRPRWSIEAFAPRKETGQSIAHAASGRHHQNQIALIEEGQGVEEPIWASAEGMCSGYGNKIFSSFNPSDGAGPAYERSRTGSYHVLHLDAFGHPNVRSRQVVIPDAISHTVIDGRVRDNCINRGLVSEVEPDPKFNDFVYALPDPDAPETGGRTDQIPGHPGATPCVFRPMANSNFEPQVLGKWPCASDSGLFNTGYLDQAMERWDTHPEPMTRPDLVGLDLARTGGDDIVALPRWGMPVEELLGMIDGLRKEGHDAVQAFVQEHRITLGRLRVIPKGEGEEVAAHVSHLFPSSPFNADAGGVGVSPIDFLRKMGKRVNAISFGGKPLRPVAGMSWAFNMRSYMYMIAAEAVRMGLVDVPNDPLLRQELLIVQVEHVMKTVRVGIVMKQVPAIKIQSKEDIQKKLRRSPDRADAFVLSLTQGAAFTHHTARFTSRPPGARRVRLPSARR